jgi:hypothetical protein
MQLPNIMYDYFLNHELGLRNYLFINIPHDLRIRDVIIST